MQNKIFLFVLVTNLFVFKPAYLIASTYVPCSEIETTEQTCFQCGSQCSVRLTYPSPIDALQQKNATLTFSGTGNMKNYGSPYTDNPNSVAPWWSLHNSVTKVVVEEGLTSVGSRTIYGMTNLQELNLPESLQKINSYAFYGTNISSLSVPKNVTLLSYAAFGAGSNYNESTYLNNLFCDESIQTQCQAMLANWNKDIKFFTFNQYGNQYYFNGKFYQSVNDLMHNIPVKKRIYTVEEATKLSKDTGNKIMLRYK